MPEKFFSIPPAKQLVVRAVGIVMLAVCSALGAAIFTASASWVGGIATNAELDQAVAPVNERVKQAMQEAAAARAEVARLSAALGQRSEVESRQTIAEWMRSSETAKTALTEKLGREVRTRVGLQAAVHVGMDPKRKAAAERAAVAIRARYDDLVLRYPPAEAAERALEQSRIPR
jgi:hypothetical protein